MFDCHWLLLTCKNWEVLVTNPVNPVRKSDCWCNTCVVKGDYSIPSLQQRALGDNLFVRCTERGKIKNNLNIWDTSALSCLEACSREGIMYVSGCILTGQFLSPRKNRGLERCRKINKSFCKEMIISIIMCPLPSYLLFHYWQRVTWLETCIFSEY